MGEFFYGISDVPGVRFTGSGSSSADPFFVPASFVTNLTTYLEEVDTNESDTTTLTLVGDDPPTPPTTTSGGLDLAPLELSIVERILTDTGEGGLNETEGACQLSGWYQIEAPNDVAYPYVVFSLFDVAAGDAFRQNINRATLTFTVYHEKPNFRKVRDIVSRLYYLFHRHTLTLSGSEWHAEAMQFVSRINLTEDDIVQEAIEFSFLIDRPSAADGRADGDQ